MTSENTSMSRKAKNYLPNERYDNWKMDEVKSNTPNTPKNTTSLKELEKKCTINFRLIIILIAALVASTGISTAALVLTLMQKNTLSELNIA